MESSHASARAHRMLPKHYCTDQKKVDRLSSRQCTAKPLINQPRGQSTTVSISHHRPRRRTRTRPDRRRTVVVARRRPSKQPRGASSQQTAVPRTRENRVDSSDLSERKREINCELREPRATIYLISTHHPLLRVARIIVVVVASEREQRARPDLI